MPRRISFTKAMHEAVRRAVDVPGIAALLERMDAACVALPPEGPRGLSFDRLLKLLDGAGVVLAMPPNPSKNWWRKMATAVDDAGLDEESAAAVVRAVGRMKPPVAPEQVVYRLSTLVAQGRGLNGTGAARTTGGWTGRTEFDDY